jgi:hypothetical protein
MLFQGIQYYILDHAPNHVCECYWDNWFQVFMFPCSITSSEIELTSSYVQTSSRRIN